MPSFLQELIARLTGTATAKPAGFFNWEQGTLIAQDAAPKRSSHYVFLGEAEDEPQLQEQAKRVLQQAKVNAEPEQFYGEVNGFSVSLNEAEATQLREIGLIKSVERDQPLPLTPPVDVQPAPTAPRQATALDDLQQEVRLENVRRGAASNAVYNCLLYTSPSPRD